MIVTNIKRGFIKTSLSSVSTTRVPIGIILQNDFTPSKWDDQTGGLVTNSGTYLDFSGGATDGSKYYVLKNMNTSLEQWKLTVDFTINTVNSTSYGVGRGFRSVPNGISAGSRYSYIQNLYTDTPDLGLNELFGFLDSSNILSGIVSGSNLRTILERDYDNIYITVQRLVAGNVVATATDSFTVTQPYSTPSPTYPLINTSALAFAPFANGGIANNTRITAYRWESQYMNHPKTLILGDSKVQGYCAGSRAATVCGSLSFANSGSANDVTAHSVTKLAEITNLIKPSKVIIQTGSNDIRNAVSSGTWQANYQTMYTTLNNAGIDVWFMEPPPETVLDLTPLTTYMTANWPTKVIAKPSSWVAATDNGADGIHWNASGNAKIMANIQTNYSQLL